MNYLAHAYLSFQNPQILVGNMISDFVKGKKKFDYAPGIQKGIQLHRAIDNFTDDHPATREGKKVFKPAVGLYAGAFVDIAYDHFLATDSGELTEQQWLKFTTVTYEDLFRYKDILPEKFGVMLPYMSQQNWLLNYRYMWGMERSFEGLVRRASYIDSSKEAFDVFQQQYDYLKACYKMFFPDLKKYAFDLFNQLDL